MGSLYPASRRGAPSRTRFRAPGSSLAAWPRDDLEPSVPEVPVERECAAQIAVAHDDERCRITQRQLRIGVADELAPCRGELLGVEADDLDEGTIEDRRPGKARRLPPAAASEIGDRLG